MKKVFTLAVAAIMSVIFMGAAASPQDTISRGYQLIDGNVHDLDGNLLIALTDGRTEDGFYIDPAFQVVYDSGTITWTGTSHSSTPIFYGTQYLSQNSNGNQDLQLGSNYEAAGIKSSIICDYSSGTIPSINLSIRCITTNTIVLYKSNIEAEAHNDTILYFPTTQGYAYAVYASGNDESGNATMNITANAQSISPAALLRLLILS